MLTNGTGHQDHCPVTRHDFAERLLVNLWRPLARQGDAMENATRETDHVRKTRRNVCLANPVMPPGDKGLIRQQSKSVFVSTDNRLQIGQAWGNADRSVVRPGAPGGDGAVSLQHNRETPADCDADNVA